MGSQFTSSGTIHGSSLSPPAISNARTTRDASFSSLQFPSAQPLDINVSMSELLQNQQKRDLKHGQEPSPSLISPTRRPPINIEESVSPPQPDFQEWRTEKSEWWEKRRLRHVLLEQHLLLEEERQALAGARENDLELDTKLEVQLSTLRKTAGQLSQEITSIQQGRNYEVVAGDTLYSIAVMFSTTTQQLIAANA
eukprot:gene25641-1717_t